MKVQPKSTRQTKREGRGRKGEGSLKRRGRDGIFWYKIPNPIPGGKPIEGSCHTADEKAAIIIKAAALTAARQPKAEVAVVDATLAEVLDDYWQERELTGRHREQADPDYIADKELSSVRSAIKRLKSFFGHIPATSLTSDHAMDFRKLREEKHGVAFTTVNHELRYLRAALYRAIEQTPPKALRVPRMWMPSEKSRVRQGFIERDRGYQEILAELPDSLKAIHVCAFHVAARCGELKKMRWDMVNFNQRLIEIRPLTAKTGEGRLVPIWGEMLEILKWQKAIRDRDFPTCPWVFFWHLDSNSVAGSRLTGITRQYKAAAVRAGFHSVTFHDNRRSGIKYAIQIAGMDSTKVRHMSGHKTDAMLMRYNITSPREMEDLGRDLDAHLAKVVDIRRRA